MNSVACGARRKLPEGRSGPVRSLNGMTCWTARAKARVNLNMRALVAVVRVTAALGWTDCRDSQVSVSAPAKSVTTTRLTSFAGGELANACRSRLESWVISE